MIVSNFNSYWLFLFCRGTVQFFCSLKKVFLLKKNWFVVLFASDAFWKYLLPSVACLFILLKEFSDEHKFWIWVKSNLSMLFLMVSTFAILVKNYFSTQAILWCYIFIILLSTFRAAIHLKLNLVPGHLWTWNLLLWKGFWLQIQYLIDIHIFYLFFWSVFVSYVFQGCVYFTLIVEFVTIKF